jgi:TolB-like protein/Tfp pilus assembly protein PilF
MPNKLSHFWKELKRRRVHRLMAIYAGSAYVIFEASTLIFPRWGLPDWTIDMVLYLLILGAFITFVLSWIYDLTPEGIQKTKPVSESSKAEVNATPNGWKIASYISIVVIAVLVLLNIIPRISKKEILEKSIAVLPFENMSSDEAFAHIGDAITDEIIVQLYKINSFVVRSRTTIHQYKDTDKGSPEIGEELNVNYLLEGSAQRFEDKVRIRVQLIHASSDDQIWGEVYNGIWEDILDIQIDVAKKVSGELKTVLSSDEVELIERKPTENLEAYNLYLLGRHFWKRRTEEDFKKSIQYFEQAIEFDPGYALAYTGMADAYIVLSDWGYFDPKEGYLKAKDYVLKAMEINQDLAEAHASLAFLRYVYDRNWTEAEKEFKRAIEMCRDDPEIHEEYAAFLSKLGQFDEAFDQINIALELDPASIISNLLKGWIYYLTKQYDEAIYWFQKALELEHSLSEVYFYISLCYLQKGLYEEEIEIYQRGMSIDPESSYYIAHVGNVYKEHGIEGFHNWLVDEGIVLTRSTYNRPYIFAWYCTALGDYDQAFQWLDKALGMNTYYLTYLKSDPCFDSLHPYPRFHELVRRIGIEE